MKDVMRKIMTAMIFTTMIKSRWVMVISLSFIIYHLSFSRAAAQGAAAQEGSYRYADAMELWRLTQNAAGLSIDNPYKVGRGYAHFDLSHRSGDYHRVQEGGQRNMLAFDTERYQNIGKYMKGYGRFTFGMDRTKGRSWADRWNPYEDSPFFTGSSVKGKYDTQLFDLTAAIASMPLHKRNISDHEQLMFGARLDYKVGDQSRLRDPRSRNELLQYRLTPAIAYSFGPGSERTIGLSGHYDRRKEKLPGIVTVQEDPNLMYYVMSGMEAATGTVGGYKSFSREWVRHELGAELSYGFYAWKPYRDECPYFTVSTLTIARATEDAWGQYKYSPGKYTSYSYGLTTRHRIRQGRLLHQADLTAGYTEGYADEYRQTLVQERDAEQGYTSFHYDTQMVYKKRYQRQAFNASLHYRLNQVGVSDVKSYVGVGAALQGTRIKHLLHTSEQDCQRLSLMVEGGYGLLGGRLWIDAQASYSPSLKADMTLADATTDYAQQVLQPDMAYYDADCRRGQLSAKYLFPLTIKGMKAGVYVKAYYDRLQTHDDRSLQTVGLSFGFYN